MLGFFYLDLAAAKSFVSDSSNCVGECLRTTLSKKGVDMQEYIIDTARREDIGQIAAIFTESFSDSILFHCGNFPHSLAMEDVFLAVFMAEPQAAFVIRHQGIAVGYCFAPHYLPRLWLQTVLGGHLLKWTWRWLTGKYGIGLYPIKMLLLNKASFLQSAFTPAKKANARILSIAVAQKFRGKGLASQLMAAAMNYFAVQKVRRIRLEVRPDNLPAIKVYKKFGFLPAGTTSDPQGDWLIMFKEMEN